MAGNGQEGFMGYVNPSQYSQYGVLPAPGQGIGAGSPLNGQAGYVGGKFGAALSGVQGGYNFEQQVQGSSRADADYKKTQEMQRTLARQQYEQTLSTPPPDPTDPMYSQKMQDRDAATKSLAQLQQPQGSQGFLTTLGTAVQKLGQGARTVGHAVAPGMIAAPGGASPLPGGGQAPQQGAIPQQGSAVSALPTGAYANGGPVTAFSPSSTPQPATPAGYDQGGPVAPPQAMPQGAAPPQQGPPQGAPPQGGPPSQQGAAPQAPPGMPGNPGVPGNPLAALPPQAQDPSGPFNKFYQGLLDASLNDKGDAPGREAIPSGTANPNVAIQSTANNPAAQKGIPEQSPAESDVPQHSLSAGWYDHQDFLAHQAAAQAAQSGHDPGAVYQAMTNMTTSFLQTHIMREASAAAVAMQANDGKGDMPAVEKALKNMYYYVPDGNELKTQKQNGQLVYQNPIFPYLDANGQPTAQGAPGATPNMQPVDLNHISMLARAAADPMQIGTIIQQARSAAVQQQTEQTKAQAALITAGGMAARGNAMLKDANVREALAPSTIFGNVAKADYYQKALLARIQGATDKPDPLAFKAGTDATGLVWQQAQGQAVTEPSMVPDPRRPGQMIPNLSPNAGHTTRDPSKVPVWAQGKNPDQLAQVAGLAGEIAAANHTTLSPQSAVNLAGMIYGHQGTQHKDPASGKPTADVKFSPDHTQGWVWTGQNWQNFKLKAQTGGNLAAGQVDNIPPFPEDASQSNGALPGANDNPDDPNPNESNGPGGNPYAGTPDADNAPAT